MTGERVVTEWTTLWPEGDRSPEWSHSGIVVLADGRVVFAEPGGHALILLDESTGAATRVPTPTEDGHGLTRSSEGGREILWIADPGPADGHGQVLRMDVAARSFATLAEPGRRPGESEGWKPTSTAVVPPGGGEHAGELWVADGYGRSRVHVFRVDGSTATFDGAGTGRPFDCPHGVVIDDRGVEPLVVVADRANRRLVFLDLDGDFVREVQDEVLTSPSSLAVRGDDLLVTDLFGGLLRVDPDDAVHELVARDRAPQREAWPNRMEAGAVVRPLLLDGRLNSPHGIAVGQEGQVYLTEWLLGGRQLRLSLENLKSG